MKKNIIPLLALFTLVVIIFGALAAFQNSKFHISHIDPTGSILPSSQKTIIFYFNKGLDKNQPTSEVVTVVPSIPHGTKIGANSIQIDLDYTLAENVKFVVNLKNVLSVGGEKISQAIPFTVGYVDYKKLSADEQKRQIADTDNMEVKYPLSSLLPIITPDFQIKYKYPAKGTKMPIIITNLAFSMDGLNGNYQSPEYLAVLRKTRTEAIQWLNQNKFNTTDYVLYFTEPELVSEFGGSYYSSN